MKMYFHILFVVTLALLLSLTSFASVKESGSKQEKQIYYKGYAITKKVALTFDDGPDTDITIKVLDILKRENVPASFFVLGRLVQKNPAIFKRIVNDGHLVAIHTWTHPILTKLSNTRIRDELRRTSDIMETYSGKKPLFVRPPYGAINKRVRKVIEDEGLTIVQWNIDTKDWKGPTAATIVGRVSSQIVPGSIILQHSAGGTQRLRSTVYALPKIIRLLKKQGYQMVTLDELLETPAYAD